MLTTPEFTKKSNCSLDARKYTQSLQVQGAGWLPEYMFYPDFNWNWTNYSKVKVSWGFQEESNDIHPGWIKLPSHLQKSLLVVLLRPSAHWLTFLTWFDTHCEFLFWNLLSTPNIKWHFCLLSCYLIPVSLFKGYFTLDLCLLCVFTPVLPIPLRWKSPYSVKCHPYSIYSRV